jgi:hypothetical protein
LTTAQWHFLIYVSKGDSPKFAQIRVQPMLKSPEIDHRIIFIEIRNSEFGSELVTLSTDSKRESPLGMVLMAHISKYM